MKFPASISWRLTARKTEAVLAQIKVDAKTNEHKAALQLLGILPVQGSIITGDAMFCQRDVCAAIIDAGGDYRLHGEGQPAVVAIDIRCRARLSRAGPADPRRFFPLKNCHRSAGGTGGHDVDKGHGRIEKRTLQTTTILTKHQDWAGLKQGFELVRERTVKGRRR